MRVICWRFTQPRKTRPKSIAVSINSKRTGTTSANSTTLWPRVRSRRLGITDTLKMKSPGGLVRKSSYGAMVTFHVTLRVVRLGHEDDPAGGYFGGPLGQLARVDPGRTIHT